MKTVEEIKYQIKIFEAVKKEWIISDENQRHQSIKEWYKENEKKCEEKIILLEWVLGLRDSPIPIISDSHQSENVYQDEIKRMSNNYASGNGFI
ncbi:hypothetical protein [Chryseobacterium sp. 2VB]|uniref:hypothetical protein n=1 Tax=Chryseobacterium sp. 2VB TaxID=2502204 RepID=UPI0010F732FD|nr:hypothetical protein [Chryseobacterium sp. 2VB]